MSALQTLIGRRTWVLLIAIMAMCPTTGYAQHITKYVHLSESEGISCGGCQTGLACLGRPCQNCMAKVRYACDGVTRLPNESPVPVCCMGCAYIEPKCVSDKPCGDDVKYLDGVAIGEESTCQAPGKNDHDCRSRSKGSINYLNGNVHHGAVVDVALPARAGVGLSFRRHYNSALAGVARALSYGWTHNLEERLIDTHTTTHVTYVREDGKQLRFIRHPTTGVYTSPKGYAFDLVQNGTRYELTAPDGTRRYFDTVSNGFFSGAPHSRGKRSEPGLFHRP